MDISKKKVLLISSMLLTLIIVVSIVLIINKNDTNEIVSNPKREVNNNNFLTLMLEQSDGTYRESTSNTWPGDGYIFNKELSSCQNGGELDYDSENNKVILYNNKSDGCYVYFDLYNKPVINSINLGEVTNNSITISVSATNGTNEINNYYYIINDETPVSTTSNTYTFSGLSAGATYTIKVYVIDSEGYSSDTSSLNVETESIVYLADWVIDQYNGIQGNNGIYYHTSSLANSAGDNSYRYSGLNPNNYVCFGSDASTCPSDNLYRIIGVFGNEIKLIKADYANNNLLGTNGDYATYIFDENSSSYENYKGRHNSVNTYYWNYVNKDSTYATTSYYNVWRYSQLNTVNLNTNFLELFNSVWQQLIENHTWIVGGCGSLNTAQLVFQNEINNPNSEVGSTEYTAKIGLMYVSDYGFAASPDYWTTNIGSYNNTVILNTNWMYLGLREWTITRRASSTYSSYTVYYSGYAIGKFVERIESAIRPCFYLSSDVQYASGSGTQSDPIRLVV